MPCIFQESPGFESRILGAVKVVSKTVLFLEKLGRLWHVAVVQKAGEKRGFFSGMVCSFLCE